jgi:hypothetical protein
MLIKRIFGHLNFNNLFLHPPRERELDQQPHRPSSCLAIIRKHPQPCPSLASTLGITPFSGRQYANIISSDLVMCRKQSGIAIGRLCDKCDGKCPVCDSYVRPTTLVRICDECSFGNYQNKCVVCGGEVRLFFWCLGEGIC